MSLMGQLSYAEYFQNGQSFWILPTGEIYSAEAMRKILNDEMVDTIMAFAESYNKLELTDLETALFSAVRLTTTTGIELEDKDKVNQLYSHLLDTLAFEMKRNHPSNHMLLLIDMFKLVPLIESINRIQSEIIANFSLKRFSK
ncbi:nuclear receptor subfamily 1 group D member 2-like [Ruditapes philippinarum]|uniref:nuclear receptor subfamily 1 group D member 2-like n=1 Tax=Ruditapes philippinarum TaxID=129788 RepID=UPI00295AD1F2|nr:nuclear receptor subfamily 1 group D member 2-like [Ruditapes philippinarum]